MFVEFLCNWLVCLAVWMAARTTNEAAKIMLIFWCLFAFVGSGFEHSIAKSVDPGHCVILPHGPDITWLGLAWNQLWVVLGNVVGGAVFVGGAYWLSSPVRVQLAIQPSNAEVGPNGITLSLRMPTTGEALENRWVSQLRRKYERLHLLCNQKTDEERIMMNKIEVLKADKDGLDIKENISRFAESEWESISEDDIQRLKWYGIFLRNPTPGFFMVRVRIPGGRTTSTQMHTLAHLAKRYGNGMLDLTTRQQFQLRHLKIEHVPDALLQLDEAD